MTPTVDYATVLLIVASVAVFSVLIMLVAEIIRFKGTNWRQRDEHEPQSGPVEYSYSRVRNCIEIASRRKQRRMNSGAGESASRNVGAA